MGARYVAPLTGSVDRNQKRPEQTEGQPVSLPSRGAWIEISPARRPAMLKSVAPLTGSVDRNIWWCPPCVWPSCVAPLTGSVDRNELQRGSGLPHCRSLPSRGAWIEIA